MVEREVVRKGRRALLIAGNDHLLRGLHAIGQPHQPNAGGLLAQRHARALFVVDSLVLPPGPQQDPVAQRLRAAFAAWPRPAFASLAGTWLGAMTQRQANGWINAGADLVTSAAAARYSAQDDTVLYVGPGEVLTASRAEPTIYQVGAYVGWLRHISPIAHQFGGPDR